MNHTDAETNDAVTPKKGAMVLDALLIAALAVLAGCGIVYEYLMSHYAGRVLGMMEHAIFTMIGVMIVSMGIGAFAARKIRDAVTGLVVTELLIAASGGIAILLIAAVFGLTVALPRFLAETYGISETFVLSSGLHRFLETIAGWVPYCVGFWIGVLVGMEIPLIARIREMIHEKRLIHNAGTVYGADYIGAGLGAAVFVLVLLRIPPEMAAVATAFVNLLVGGIFVVVLWKWLFRPKIFLCLHLLFAAALGWVAVHVGDWHETLEDLLYMDRVIYQAHTDYQHITVTERTVAIDSPPAYTLYLNGHTQFCSSDEALYHSLLVAPPMMAAARNRRILLVGGGDGLALRDILRFSPESVTVLELDREMVRLFSEPVAVDGRVVNQPLMDLTMGSFSDPRVDVVYGDAYNSVDAFLRAAKRFDVILVDLPDPSSPDLNKLYSRKFYGKLKSLLTGDGSLAIQSTSPYHALDAFLTVGVTLKAAGFAHVERYHANIPSFGEWGWTIATPFGSAASTRIRHHSGKLPEGLAVNRAFVLAAFAFPQGLIAREASLLPNTLGSHRMYFYHQRAWKEDQTIVFLPETAPDF